MHHDAEQIEQLLGSADPAREDDDAVSQTHEGLQSLLDVRQYHQLVDDGVRRFGGDDGGFGEADVAAIAHPLLGVADGGPLHGPFHGSRPAAGADVELSQAQLAAHGASVLVLHLVDGVTAPADHQVGIGAGQDRLGVAQYGEHHIGDVGGAGQVDQAIGLQLGRDIEDVAQHGEQVLLDAADDLAIDEGVLGGIEQLEFDPALAPDHMNVEGLEALQYLFGAVGVAAGVEHRQRAVAKQLIDIAGGGLLEAIHLKLGQQVHAAHGIDVCNHNFPFHSLVIVVLSLGRKRDAMASLDFDSRGKGWGRGIGEKCVCLFFSRRSIRIQARLT
ncbi:hypothetical protein D3C80_866270 [compost metagenome]